MIWNARHYILFISCELQYCSVYIWYPYDIHTESFHTGLDIYIRNHHAYLCVTNLKFENTIRPWYQVTCVERQYMIAGSYTLINTLDINSSHPSAAYMR